MQRLFSIFLTLLLLSIEMAASTAGQTTSVLQTQTKKLPYPVREAIKRQTGNVSAIEKKLAEAKANASKPLNPMELRKQQMLQQMLATNPNLKAQLDANPSMLNQLMGKSPTGLDGMEDQRLESAMQDLRSNRAPMNHPEVSALIKRIESIRQGILDLKNGNFNKMATAKKANDLSDFPDFRKDLNTIKSFASKFDTAAKSLPRFNKLLKKKELRKNDFYQNLNYNISLEQLKNLMYIVNNKTSIINDVNSLTHKYKPVFDRNPNYKLEWTNALSPLSKHFSAFDAVNAVSTGNILNEMFKYNLQEIRARVKAKIDSLTKNNGLFIGHASPTKEDVLEDFKSDTSPQVEPIVKSNDEILNYIGALGDSSQDLLIQAKNHRVDLKAYISESSEIFYRDWYSLNEKRIKENKVKHKLRVADAKAKQERLRKQLSNYDEVAEDPAKYARPGGVGFFNRYNSGDRRVLESVIKGNMSEYGSKLKIIGMIIPANWDEKLFTESIHIYVGEKLDDDYVLISEWTLKRDKNNRGSIQPIQGAIRSFTTPMSEFEALKNPQH